MPSFSMAAYRAYMCRRSIAMMLRQVRRDGRGVGIMLDVLAKYPKADEPTLVNWVRRWTGHWEYLKRMAHGCNRHDLEGNDVPPSLITSATKHAGGLRRGTERRENRRDCSP